jgi:CelD/BcsL family acetyltransferase involved in cellulose biosynthesis
MLSVGKASFRPDVDIRVESDFDFMSDEYRGFYRRDRATVFQAPLWLDMIHKRLAPGLGAAQRTLTVRDSSNGCLRIVVPLVLQRIAGIRMLAPADFGVCDYNSVVGDRQTLDVIASDPSLAGRIEAALGACDILMFRKVRGDDFDVQRLLPRSRNSIAENAAYHIDVGDDFEAWQRRKVRRKFSKEIGRLQRQTEREFNGYEHRPAESEAEIRDAFDHLRSWRMGRFEDDLLKNPLYFDFYLDYAIAGRVRGEAITYVSYAGGKPGAVLFGPAVDGVFNAVLIGADTERLGKQSPGLQIIYRVIKRRFEEGFRTFDMGLGNTGYKTQFRVDETPVRNHTKSYSLAGFAVAAIYHRAKPVKNFLRNRVPNVH